MDNRLFIEAEKTELDRITKALGGLSYKAPAILKDAANTASKYGVKATIKAARARYDFKRGEGGIRLQEAVKRSTATYANPRSVISVKSKMNKMIHFRVNPLTPANAPGRPAAYRGRVLKGSSMDEIRDNGVKAFVVKFKEGGLQVVSRRLGKSYSSGPKGKLGERARKKLDPTKIDVVYAPSATHMFSKAFDSVRTEVEEKLRETTQELVDGYLDSLKGAGR